MMFGYAFGEFAFGEPLSLQPAESSDFQQLLRDTAAERVYLVEIYPYEFAN